MNKKAKISIFLSVFLISIALIAIYLAPTVTGIIYELSNITTDAELNNVVCEGGNEYCHSALNDSNIVLYMPFDVQENGNNVTYDFSSYNNDGISYVNGSGDGSPSGWNSTGGINGTGAYEFDGVDDYIDAGNSNAFIFGNGSGDFVVSMWVKIPFGTIPSAGIYPDILSKGLTSSAPAKTWGFAQKALTNNQLNWYQSSEVGGTWVVAMGTGNLTDGWHNILAVRNGSNTGLYIDGNYYTQDISAEGNLTNNNNLIFGIDGAGHNWNGTIDEVMIFNRSLEADEITALYNAQFGRFYSQGNLTTNETTIEGKYSNVNLTIHSQNQIGADLNCSVYDGTSWQAYQNMTTENPTEFNISSSASTTSLNTSCIFIEDPYAFYTPILLQNITYETTNFANNIPTQSNPYIAAELEVRTLGSDTSSNGLNETIVGYWKLNRYGSPDESSVLDETGVNNGTLSGFNNDSLSGPTYSGRVGSAFNFDGVDDYVNIPYNSNLRFSDDSGIGIDFSVSAWIYSNLGSSGNADSIVGYGNPYSADGEGYIFYYLVDDSQLGLSLNNDSGLGLTVVKNSGDLRGAWHYVVVTADRDASATFYLDGSSLGSGSISTKQNGTLSNDNTRIGRYGVSAGDYFFNGSIDEVSIYNVSLSSDEVMQLYLDTMDNHTGSEATIYTTQDLAAAVNGSADADNDNLTSIFNWYEDNESLMVLNMPFDSNSTYPARDYSVYNNSGSCGNSSDELSCPFWNSTGGIDKDIPGLRTGAYEFDGVDDYVNLGSDMIGTGADSICAWIYPIGWGEGSGGRIVNNGNVIFIVSSALSNLRFTSDQFSTTALSASSSISLNKWYHTCAERNASGSTNLYVNGVASGTANQDSGTPVAGTNVIIGNNLATTSSFNGTIDSVQIYNRSLSAEEIYQLYLKNYNKLTSQETTKGKSYYSEVYVNDGYDDSTPYNTSEITILNSAPSIPVLNTPADNEHINSQTPEFNGTYSDIDLDLGSCDLLLNSTASDAMLPSGIQTSISSVISIVSNTTLNDLTNYKWAFMCSDGTDISYSDNRTVFIDVTTPVITWTIPSNNNGTNVSNSFNANVNVLDTNLYQVNISVWNKATNEFIYNNFTDDLNGSGITSFDFVEIINISDAINISGVYIMQVEASDTHTLKEWNPTTNITSIDKGLNFLFNNKDSINISIPTVASTTLASLDKFNYEKLQGRYRFDLLFTKKISSMDIKVEADKIVYLDKSNYKGHLILDDKYWFDTEPYEVSEIKSGKGYVILTITSNTDKISFNSIGGLNIVTENAEFLYDPDAPNITSPSVAPTLIPNNTFVNFKVIVDDVLSPISSVALKLWNTITNVWDWFWAWTTGAPNEYEYNITLTDLYNQSQWQVNDTSNNVNITAGAFPEIDVTPPLITLNSPLDNVEFQDGTVSFNYTSVDVNLANCTLFINLLSENYKNTTLNSGEDVIETVYNLQNALDYKWHIDCFDTVNNNGTSVERTIKIRVPNTEGRGGSEAPIEYLDRIEVYTNNKWFGNVSVYVTNYNNNNNSITVDNVSMEFNNKTYELKIYDDNLYSVIINADVPLGNYSLNITSKKGIITLEKYLEIEVIEPNIIQKAIKGIEEVDTKPKDIMIGLGIISGIIALFKKRKKLKKFKKLSYLILLVLAILLFIGKSRRFILEHLNDYAFKIGNSLTNQNQVLFGYLIITLGIALLIILIKKNYHKK